MRLAFVNVLVLLLGFAGAGAAELLTLDGQPTAPTVLLRSRVAMLFVVVPGVDDVVRVVEWFDSAAKALPDVAPFVLAPEETLELRTVAESYPDLSVLIDQHATFGIALGIQDVPALVTLLDGRVREWLMPPFSRDDLLEAMEALAVAERRGPIPLIGTSAPAIEGKTPEGEARSLDTLPLPAFLVFLSPGCPFCWDLLDELKTVEADISVVLVVEADGLTADYEERLEAFLGEAPAEWELLLAPEGVREAYRVLATPTSFLLDDRAVIHSVLEGAVPGPILENEAYQLFAELVSEDP